MSPTRRAAAYISLLVLIAACGFAPTPVDDDEEVPAWAEPAVPAAPVGPAQPVTGLAFQNAPRPGALSYRATVTRATGLAGVAPQTECRIWIQRDDDSCQANVECGPHVLWGRGGGSFCPCAAVGDALSGGEDMMTSADGDGAFRFDTGARTMVVRDSADGPLGAFEVEARFVP